MMVMLVDDEDKNMELLEAMLLPGGYKIAKAKSGDEAISLLEKVVPDLILLDVMMPGKTGFQTLAEIRNNPETRAIPVIMITALTGREDKLKGLDAGADDFISKPFDKTELLSKVRTLSSLSVLRRQIDEKERLAGVLDIMREGVIITDCDFKVTQINDMAKEFLFLKEAPPDLAVFLLTQYGYTVQKDSKGVRVTVSRSENDPHTPLFLSVEYRKIIKPGTEKGFYVFVFKDVTEIHTRDKVLLEHLYVIAQKLQTPMNVISGYAKILDFFAADEKLKGSVSSIMKNSLVMEKLIKRVLYYAGLEKNVSPGEMNTADLTVLTARLAREYGRDFELIAQTDKPVMEYWLRIAAEELIENSFKYFKSGKLSLIFRYDADTLVVEDNGPGIPEEERLKVFEMFYEVNRNMPSNMSSPGLGLSIVKRLAESAGRIVLMETSKTGGLRVIIRRKENSDLPK